MEIIVALVVLAVVGVWAWNANNAKKDQSSDKHPLDIINDNAVEKQAPYTVPEPAATTPIPLVVKVVEVEAKAEVVTEAVKPAKKAAPAKKAPAKKVAPAKKTTAKKTVV